MATKPETVLGASDVTSTLNGLIETCLDGEKGYSRAAEHAKESSLKALFAKYSSQRAGYARELAAAVTTFGDQPSDTGHVAATMHRGWITVKEALSSDSDLVLIDECEAGEDAAMKNYKEALQKDLPPMAETLVRNQFGGVSEAHNVIRDLKHSRHGAKS